MARGLRRWACSFLAMALGGCGEEPGALTLMEVPVQREAERWSQNERPSLLGMQAELRLHALPTGGEVKQMPWPGSHWPLTQDGVNARWDGPDSLSAVEKLGIATGILHLEDAVSAYYGIDAHRGEGRCFQDKECPGTKPVCAKRRGATRGVCVGDWWGVCHGWSPAAILEPEPQHPVMYNGVEFKVNDIKALLTLAYTAARNTQLGERSEWNRFGTDRAGRATKDIVRQINPGTFHVAVANMVGLRHASLTVDRDLTYRVFNHPIASYQVQSIKQVDVPTANRLLGVSSRSYPYASGVASLYHVTMALRIVMDTQAHEDGPLVPHIDRYSQTRVYSYILELDAHGQITGGEWLGRDKLNHPDFLWRSTGLAASHRAGGAVHIATIREIAAKSRD